MWLSLHCQILPILLHITVTAAASADFATIFLVDSYGRSVGLRKVFDKYVSRLSDKELSKPNWARLAKCFESDNTDVIETLKVGRMQIVHTGTAKCPATSKEVCDFVDIAVPDDLGYQHHACISDSSSPKYVPTTAGGSTTPSSNLRMGAMSSKDTYDCCPLYPPNDPLFYLQEPLYQALRIGTTWQLITNSKLPRRDVIIGVLDTGILEDYPDFVGKVLEGYDASGDPISSINDSYGHGTAMTSIVGSIIGNGYGTAGIADRVKFRPVRLTSDERGAASTSQFMRGLEEALQFDDIDILLIAYSDEFTYDEGEALSELLNSAQDILVITTGMSVDTRRPQIYLPCRLHRYFNNVVCAVATETDNVDVLVYNSTLDASLGVPSTNVIAPFIVEGELEHIPVTGSSASTAITTGIAALMMSFNTLTPTEVKQILVATADGKVKTKKGYETGIGLIRPDLAIGRAIARASHVSEQHGKMLGFKDRREQRRFSPTEPGRRSVKK